MSKPKLAISFSGGRSSAVMTKLCLEKYGDTHEIVVTFANTGCEHPATLDFVRDCDQVWGFNTVWLEAVVTHGANVGIRAKVVDYATASRNGEPFEQFVKKYGIPGPSHPQCTSRLKTEVMENYLKSVGFDTRLNRRNYLTAVGIRADEIDRMSAKQDQYRFIYPLIDAGYTKDMVLAECRSWPFDLQLPSEAYGNCVWCWKKSLRKLLTLAKEDPAVFDFPRRLELQYGTVKAYNTRGVKTFFRGNRSASDILNMAEESKFEPYQDSKQLTIWDELLDLGGACSDGCEVGHD